MTARELALALMRVDDLDKEVRIALDPKSTVRIRSIEERGFVILWADER